MQVNNNNFLNASQVSQIRNSLIGTNETQMPSVFNSVKHLDNNNNKTIEQNEVSNNDILSLGKDVLTKIANFFGISIDNDTNSSSGDINGENKDQIVENYAKPFSQISTEEMTQLSKNEKIILSKEENDLAGGKEQEAEEDQINPDSIKVIEKAFVEGGLDYNEDARYQFVRNGYFCLDKDTTENKMVFNRVVGLKDSYRPETK